MAFLGDVGKVLGLGSSTSVLGNLGESVGSFFGIGGTGRRIGETVGEFTSGLSGGTADQPLEQSAVPTPMVNGRAQETSRSGSQTVNVIDVGRNNGMTSEAGFGALAPIISAARS